MGWKRWLAILLAAMLAPWSVVSAQDNYPSRPIKLLVPWPAGNLTDTIARMLAEKLTKSLGQSVWVENKGGASGLIGMEALSKSPPDGYTIGISAIGPLAMNPAIYPKLPYDPVGSFSSISMLWSGPMVVLVPTTSPVKSLSELIERSKQNTSGIDYASPGKGTLQHITAELLKSRSGARLNHIPYRGSSQAVTATLGDQVPVLVETLSVALPYIRAGKMRALAVSTASRSKLLPDVPTISELGYPDVVTDGWICLIAPSGLPREIQTRLNAEVHKVLETEQARSWATGQGGWLSLSTPEELAKHVKTEVGRLGEIIRTANISAD